MKAIVTMKFSHATTLLAIASVSTASAFSTRSASVTRSTKASVKTPQYAVSVDLPDSTNTAVPEVKKVPEATEEPFDMTGVALSGLEGKALQWKESDFPKAKDLRAVIPKDCFEPETKTSMKYLSVSVIGTTLCSLFGARMLNVFNPASVANLPFWAAYSTVTGTVAMGLWVLAHECGHGAFSKNKKIQDTVGYILHSLFLVPYYSWQRSHAVHHQYTNHMELGETHVPETASGHSLGLRNSLVAKVGKSAGIKIWGSLQAFLHLIIGWPAYLLIGATGGPDRGMTNHYWPNPLTTPKQPRRELFPGNWKAKVMKSDIGVVAVGAAVGALGWFKGLPLMMAMYGGPLIVVNAWLVLYTWLQHTDVDVPHFSSDKHSFVKGALHTIDRPYDKLDPFGFIDFLHHKIGTTHVAHHFDSSIPHYKAQVATDAIKKAYPKMHLYDPTPIPKALWRIAKGCTAVEKRGDKWIWKNSGLEPLL